MLKRKFGEVSDLEEQPRQRKARSRLGAVLLWISIALAYGGFRLAVSSYEPTSASHDAFDGVPAISSADKFEKLFMCVMSNLLA